MANISRCFEVAPSFSYSFFFHEKKEKVELVVYDVASRLIHSSELSKDVLADVTEEDESSLRSRVSRLLHLGYEPKYDEILKRCFWVSPTKSPCDYSVIQQSIEDTIAFIKPRNSFEPTFGSSYTDPITHMLFVDPVVDHEGHTFERESIKQWLRLNAICPIGKHPLQVTDLSSNYSLKAIVEEKKAEFNFPTLKLFQGEKNKKISDGFIKQARALEEEKKFDEALESYRKALVYTNELKDYGNIPQLFEKKEDCLSACLAYLYLAQYQLEETAYDEALKSLIKARDLQKDIVELKKPIAMFFKGKGRDEEAFYLFNEMGESFAKSKETTDVMAAIEAYQNAILVNPDAVEVYKNLANLYADGQQKANIYLLAVNHFMKKNAALAKEFAIMAFEIASKNPLNYFFYIQLLEKEKDTDQLVTAYLRLSEVYKALKDRKNKLHCLRKVVELKPSGQIYERIISNFLELKNKKKSLEYFVKLIDYYIGEKKWNAAETVAQRALKHFNEKIIILRKLREIYTVFLNEHLHPLLLRLGKAYVLLKSKAGDELARKTYMQAWSEFEDVEAYFEVIQINIRLKQYEHSVNILFDLARHSFFKEDITLLNKCLKTILEIDPELKFLTKDKQLNFLTFLHIRKLSAQMQELKRRMDTNESKDIYQSCAIGDIDHVRKMVDKVKDPKEIKRIIEIPNDKGLNLLHIAILNNQEEIIALLLNLQADASKCIDVHSGHELAGLSPIDIAAKKGNNALIILLMKAGAQVVTGRKKTPLHFAVENGFFSTVQLLLSYDAPTNSGEPDNSYTPLHLAVLNKRLGITKLLVFSKDIDLGLLDKDNHNPLYYAVEKTLPDFVRVICETKKTALSSEEIDVLQAKNKENLSEDNREKIKEIEEILNQAKKKIDN